MAKKEHEAIQQKRAAALERRQSIRAQKIAARDQKIAEHRAKGGLREQKKRETRQHISDVATRMFMEQGFDNVRVSDVAEKCGVSEKTIFNYFINKEALVLDQEEPMTERLREALGPGATISPANAMSGLADETVENMIGHGLGSGHMQETVGRFMAMVETTPALSAARDAATKRLFDAAAESLGARYGRDPHDAEIRLTAIALVGFWDIARTRAVHYGQLGKKAAEIRKLTRKDLVAAAKLLHTGLDGSFMGEAEPRKRSARK